MGGDERGVRHGRRSAEACAAAACNCSGRVGGGGGGAGVVGSPSPGAAPLHHWSSEFVCHRGLSDEWAHVYSMIFTVCVDHFPQDKAYSRRFYRLRVRNCCRWGTAPPAGGGGGGIAGCEEEEEEVCALM